MRINWRIPGAAAVTVAVFSLTAAGCSKTPVTPSIGDIAIVVGGGAHSNQTIHDVVPPGEHIKVPKGDRRYFLPASNRDYLTDNTAANPDRSQGALGYTQASKGTKGQPGLNQVAVFTYDRVPFMLNPNHAVLRKFFTVMCSKYGWSDSSGSSPNCAATRPGAFNGANSLSATAGWISMLNANFALAIDSATQSADQQFGPDLWYNGGQWGNYAQDVADALPAALQKATGSGSYRFFCGYGSTETHCAGFTVQILNIAPADQNVIRAYDQAATAAYNARAAQSRAQVARALYGNEAPYWTGLQDTLSKCGSSCPTIYIGAPQGAGVPGK